MAINLCYRYQTSLKASDPTRPKRDRHDPTPTADDSPTWTTQPYRINRCLQDSPVCCGQSLDRIGDHFRVHSLEIEL
jgi:hypothetical protein